MPYTIGEKLKLGWLVAKETRQAHAAGEDWQPDPRTEREMDRIERRAEQREEADFAAAQSVVGRARLDVAAARSAVRTARGFEAKRKARDELRDIERGLRRVERDARRRGYSI